MCRDFSNGYLVAEILSRYFPAEINLCSFDNGVALSKKIDNWEQITKFLERHGIPVPKVRCIVYGVGVTCCTEN